MKQHKWHKEIKAWADGAEIEERWISQNTVEDEWREAQTSPMWDCDGLEFRIKSQPKEPQCKTHPDSPHGFCRDASHSEDRYVCECEFWEEPKQPQYLYVYLDDDYEFSPIKLNTKWKYIGKIKLEVEDGN
jgi:hypothetical protein